MFEAAAISFRRRPAAAPAPGGAAAADSATATDAGGAAPATSGADTPTKRRRARRVNAELTADGGPVTGARLAEAAGLSPSYARELLAEFTSEFPAELPAPADHNGHPATINGPAQDGSQSRGQDLDGEGSA